MMTTFLKFVSRLKYWLLAFFSLFFLCPWFMYAADDLMRQIMEPAVQSKATIDIWKSVNRVWKNVIEWWYSMELDLDWLGVNNKPSIIVKVTRILLALVIALSVTMILYNWLIYIVQTWQWKEWKSLIKNVVYIVIGILLSLFSVTIITLLQSVSTTLNDETKDDRNQTIDERTVGNERKGISWKEVFNLF